MRIGELAQRTGLAASRIRFYETNGLLPKPVRSRNGYRAYPESTVATLRLIHDAQKLGFSLSEIGYGLAQAGDGPPKTHDMLEALHCKLESLDRHIAEVTARRHEIVRLIAGLRDCAKPAAKAPRSRRRSS